MIIIALFFGSIFVLFLLSSYFPFLDNDLVILTLSAIIGLVIPVLLFLIKEGKKREIRKRATSKDDS